MDVNIQIYQKSSLLSHSLQTSPRDPLKKHFESQLRIPNRLVKLNAHAEPPESEHKAKFGLFVHLIFKTPLFGVIELGNARTISPLAVSIIKISPRAKPANSLSVGRLLSPLNAILDTAPCSLYSLQHHRSVCVISNARMKPCDVPTAIISATATEVANPEEVRSCKQSENHNKSKNTHDAALYSTYNCRRYLSRDTLQNNMSQNGTGFCMMIVERRCWCR